MTSEFKILAWYGLVMMITIIIQATMARGQVGDRALLGSREDMPRLTGLAFRLDRAQNNNTTAMALFAPAVLLLGETGGGAGTLLAAQIFLAARVAYVIAYAADISVVRTLIWFAGFGSTAWLYWQSV